MTLHTHYVMVKILTAVEDRLVVHEFVQGSLEIGMGSRPESVEVLRATETDYLFTIGAVRRVSPRKRKAT